MNIKAKVAKFSDQRKIVEIPKAVRHNFEIGEAVIISSIESLEKVSPQKAQWAREILEEIKKKEAEAP